MNTNLRLASLVAASFSMALAAYGCSSDDNNTADSGVHPDANVTNPDAGTTPNPDAGTTTGFQQPSDTVPVNFTIDDTANKTYTAGELRWKGSFTYDQETRLLTKDTSWAGGDSTKYPPVYDDGPWNAGGHEPAGATAGDNKWGVTVFFPTPTEDTAFEYGAEDNSGWIWRGSNGTFTVPANGTAAVDAAGLVIPAFGQIDMKLEIDTAALAEGFTFTAGTTTLTVKGSAWSWAEVPMTQDGTTSKYTFELGQNVGAGTSRPHSGKLNSGDVAEFVFVIGGVEYKASGAASATGVKAYLKVPPATTWTEAPITIFGTNMNTAVTAP